MPPQVASDAEPGDAADLGADLLNGAHQRVAEDQRPAQIVAELRTRLGIGGDAARIVIRGAGDQTGAEHGDELGVDRLFHRIRRRRRGIPEAAHRSRPFGVVSRA
jgi:hypothetical protein